MRKNNSHALDIVITGNVAWLDTKTLSWDYKLTYGIIRGLTRNDFYCCYASNAYLSELLQKEESTIRRALGRLEKLGLVFRTDGYILSEASGEIHYCQRLIVLSELKKSLKTSKIYCKI